MYWGGKGERYTIEKKKHIECEYGVGRGGGNSNKRDENSVHLFLSFYMNHES